jgi:hypothetical protein
MAVAAPARKAEPAPAPSRTAAPVKPAPARKRPLRPTRSSVSSRGGVAAPARKPAAPGREKSSARTAPARKPARKAAPKRTEARTAASARKAPARKAPARKTAPRSRARALSQRAVAGGQLIPIAAGRTAVAVRQLPDSGLVMQMTRSRAWIAVLGVLLVGIVGLNVATLSFAASSGKIDGEIRTLEQENGVLKNRVALLYGTERARGEASALGLSMPSSDQIHLIEARPDDVARAAQRLAAAGG